MSLATVRDVLVAVDHAERPVDRMLERSPPPDVEEQNAQFGRAAAELQVVLERQGRQVAPSAPALRSACSALAVAHRLGEHGLAEQLDGYAGVAEALAQLDSAALAGRNDDRESAVAVLGAEHVASLRQMAPWWNRDKARADRRLTDRRRGRPSAYPVAGDSRAGRLR